MESRSNLDTSYYSLWICITCSVSCIFSWLADISTPKSIDKIPILPGSMLIWCDQYLTNYIDLKEIKIKATTKDYSLSMFNPFGYGNVGSVINKCWYPSLSVIFNFIWSKKNRQIFYPDMITDILYILSQQYRNERCSKILSLGRVFIVTQNSWQVAM